MIFIDNMDWPYGRMIMNHMVSNLLDAAEARNELDSMADKIGVARKWIQKAGTPDEHYDVSLAMKRAAIALGAVECEPERIVDIIKMKRKVVQP